MRIREHCPPLRTGRAPWGTASPAVHPDGPVRSRARHAGGREGIEFFTEIKTVFHDYTGSARKTNIY